MKLPLGTLLVTPRGVIVLLEAGFEITRFVEHTVKKNYWENIHLFLVKQHQAKPVWEGKRHFITGFFKGLVNGR